MEETKSLNSYENITSLIWKLSIGSALAWEISKFFGSSHPYLGPVSLILTVQSTIDKTISLSIKRVIAKDYAMDRMRDTLVGVLTAGLIQFVWTSLISRKKELK